ncbi:MAG: tetratricopeptide repeat protein [Oligoflexales bacterium]|nr:tetratricopeptide repeat protein [Oligoflexales bacterium]
MGINIFPAILIVSLFLGFSGGPGLYALSSMQKKETSNQIVTSAGFDSADDQAKFQKGVGYFNRGDYSAASSVFQELLKKYKDHVPSKIYLARTFFQQRDFSESIAAFKEIPMEKLPPEARHEFGLSYYQEKQYENAISQLKTIPKNHKLYDLSNYYAAQSAFKIERYSEAKSFIEKAVVLPAKYTTVRNQLKKKIDEQLGERKGEAVKLSAPIKDPIPAARQPVSRQIQAREGEKEGETPPAALPRESVSKVKEAESKNSSSSETKKQKNGISNTKIGLGYVRDDQSVQFDFNSERRSGLDSTYAGIGLSLASGSYGKGAAETFVLDGVLDLRVEKISYDNAPLNIQRDPKKSLRASSLENSNLSGEALADVDLNLGASYFFDQDNKLGVSAGIFQVTPKFNQKQMSALRGMKLYYTGDLAPFSLFLDSGLYQYLGSGYSLGFSQYRENVIFQYEKREHYRAQIGGMFDQFDYYGKNINGPDLINTALANLLFYFSYGVEVGGEVFYEYSKDYHLYNLSSPMSVIFNQTAEGGSLMMNIVPLEWIRISIRGFIERKYFGDTVPDRPDIMDVILKNHFNYVSGTSFSVALEKTY